MNAFLPGMESEQRKPELSQWYTDPKLAKRVWAWANQYRKPSSVLEPAAGQGALIKPIFAAPLECKHVVAVELDDSNVQVLRQRAIDAGWRQRDSNPHCEVIREDFLRMYGPPRIGGLLFDLALMNPPYEEGRAEAFILHALTICDRVVGIFKASILHGVERSESLWSKCHTMREVRLIGRPTFGRGTTGESGKTDFVVLEIHSGPTHKERCVLTQNWP